MLVPSRLARVIVAASLVALAACSGGSSTGTGAVPNTNGSCDPGTSVQLARPFPGQGGVSTATNSIEIVASGNNNTLYNSYTMWDVVLTSNFASTVTGQPLALAPADQSAPHPYQSDFYYTSSISGLASGVGYNAFLNAFNTNCQPIFLGSFST